MDSNKWIRCFFTRPATLTYQFWNVNGFWLHDWAVDVMCDILISVLQWTDSSILKDDYFHEFSQKVWKK